MQEKTREDGWAEKRFGNAEMGDKRLTQRLILLVGWMVVHLGKSFAQVFAASNAMREAAYRFVENPRLSLEMLAGAGYEGTVAAAKGSLGDLLAIQDTTGLSYAHNAEGIGDLGGKAGSHKRGFFCHSTLLIEGLSGATLGLVDQMYWARDKTERGRSSQRRERPYEDKESYKWEAATDNARERLQDVRDRVIWVADRESDVYEYLMNVIGNDDRFIVRASVDRVLPDKRHLFECARGGKWMASGRVNVPARPGVAARTARVETRSCNVTLGGPAYKGDSLPPLPIQVVLVREVEPPAGVHPIEWVLLTSEPVGTPEQTVTVVRYYACRWTIEVFHFAWKSGGTQVESLQMQTSQTLLLAATLLAQVAVGLLQLRDSLFDGTVQIPRLQLDAPPPRCPAATTAHLPCHGRAHRNRVDGVVDQDGEGSPSA